MTDPVSTTCMRCAVGCGHVQMGVDDGYGLEQVRGDASHPVNRGLACERGVTETADPDGEWLTVPQVRTNGKLTPVTWEKAIDTVVERFADVREKTPHGIAVLGSGQQTNEAAYELGKLARGAIGTRYYDANTTLCMASAVNAYYDAFGSDAPPPTYEDIPEADTHVVWGANPIVAHPVMFRWIADSAEADDGELIVVDPVRSETAEAADTHVAPAPGGDLALARALLARAVDRDAVDEAFVAEATTGFEALRADLPDAAAAAGRAGVALSTVDDLLDAFDRDTLVYWGMGVNQSVQGTDTAGAIIDCCLATGNMGPGSGPFSLTGQANSMGTRVCSCKGGWPGMQDYDDPAARTAVADEWNVDVDRIPEKTGPGPVGTLGAVQDGPVEAIYAVATNPVAGAPEAEVVADQLEDAFLVVQDAFRTSTIDHADVVLPAATWGESDGTAINMERRVSRVRPATELPPGVRTDLELITTIGNELAPEVVDADPEPADVFDELAGLTAGAPADCSGISYERLAEDMAVRWPAPHEEANAGYRYYDDGEWSFETPSGLARFANGTGRPLPEPPGEEYPLTLTTAREADGYNTGVRSRPSPEEAGLVTARIHPETASEAVSGSETGTVRIESRRSSVRATIDTDEGIPRDMIWLPIHHPATNDLTVPDTDPQSDEPNLKQCAVRLVSDRQSTAVPGGERA